MGECTRFCEGAVCCFGAYGMPKCKGWGSSSVLPGMFLGLYWSLFLQKSYQSARLQIECLEGLSDTDRYIDRGIVRNEKYAMFSQFTSV